MAVFLFTAVSIDHLAEKGWNTTWWYSIIFCVFNTSLVPFFQIVWMVCLLCFSFVQALPHKSTQKNDEDGKYHLNMHIDHFGPYAVNKQVVRDLLDASINFPGRCRKKSIVESSTMKVYI